VNAQHEHDDEWLERTDVIPVETIAQLSKLWHERLSQNESEETT
jgi:hypothetical protein